MRLMTWLPLHIAVNAMPLQAQDAPVPVIPTAIESVVTLGDWDADGRRGGYRVITESTGWEHVRSRVHVQWISEDPGRRESVVLKAITIQELNWACSLGAPTVLANKPNRLILKFTGTEPHTMEPCTFVIELGSPGNYKVRKRKIGR